MVAIRRLLVLGLSLAGCAHFPEAPAYPHQAEGFEAVEVVEPPGLPQDRPQPLTLQPGDTVTIESRSDQTQSFPNLVIDATGKIHLPLPGDVEIGGLGLHEAEQRIQEALQRFDKFAQVTLLVTARAGQRATVLGVVNDQGSVELIPGARVTDLLAGAGGPVTTVVGPNRVPVADLGAAVLTRKGEPVPISVPKALRGDPRHNVYVLPGDHLYVPPALGSNVSILGQVGAPAVLAHREGLRLTEALTLAGGVTAGADKGDIRVIRGTLQKPLVYQASVADIIDGDIHDVLIAPGDIIFVTDHPIEDFGEVMAVIAPVLSIGFSSLAFGLAVDGNRTVRP